MANHRPPGPVLDQRTLNRTLLARQLLLHRHAMPALAAIDHLVGLQAQAPTPPYFGLWSRLDGFDPAEVSRLLVERRAVRAPLMRGTIHLVSAPDSLPLRALMRPIYERAVLANAEHRRALAGVDHDQLAAAGRELLSGRPLTNKALGELLAARWPDRPPRALVYGVQCLLALVQVPPRGVWGASGQPTWTTTESWLDESWLDQPAGGLDAPAMVRRYLAAFGPASVADVQQWCGLTGLGEVMAELPVRTFRDERGRLLYDLPDAPLSDPDEPAPVRFIAPFDNLLLSHADRTRVISDEHRRLVFTVNGIVKGTLLVDGFVAGEWKVDERRPAAALNVDLFGKVSARDRRAIEAEGSALLSFAAPGATAREVRFTT